MKSVLNVKSATIFIFIQCLPTLFYREFPNNTTNMMVYICHIQAKLRSTKLLPYLTKIHNKTFNDYIYT